MVGTALLAMSIVVGFGGNCEGQNPPVLKVHAYQRDVIGGIPGGPPGVGAPARQTRYFIYLETAPDADVAVEGVWIGREFHSVETAIKQSPVKFETAVKLADEQRSIAVPATKNKVTEIVVKDPVPGRSADKPVASILEDNPAVVQLRYLAKPILIPINHFDRRDPIYMR